MKKLLSFLILLLLIGAAPADAAQERTVSRQKQETTKRSLGGLGASLQETIRKIDGDMEELSRTIHVNEQFVDHLVTMGECPLGEYAYQVNPAQVNDDDEFVSPGGIECVDGPIEYVTTPVSYGTWSLGAWSTCSETCGGGTRTRTAVCSTTQCDPATRPADVTEACNTQACPVVGPTCPAGSNGICLATNDCGSGFSCQDSCCVPDTVSCRPSGHVFDLNDSVRSGIIVLPEPRCCSGMGTVIGRDRDQVMCVAGNACEDKTVKEIDYNTPFRADVQIINHPECPCGALTGGPYRNGIFCRAVQLGGGTQQ